LRKCVFLATQGRITVTEYALWLVSATKLSELAGINHKGAIGICRSERKTV